MATKKNVDAAGRRVKKAGEAPLARYLDKDITPVTADIVAFIKEQTGYDADPMSVQLGSVLRGTFQKSEGNQARIAARKVELEAEAAARAERAEKREANKAAKAAKAAEPKAPVAKKTPAVKTAKTATATKAAPAKKTPAPKAAVKTTTRRRPATKAPADF